VNTTERCAFYSIIHPPASKRHDFKGDEFKSATQQHFRADADINQIVKRAVDTGEPLPFKPGAQYGDVSILTDYHQALQMINDAQDHFDGLPAKIRKRFDNDPGKLIDFLGKPENYAEGIELGFYEGPKEPPAPPKVTVPPGGVITETLKTATP